jgi:GTP cyclohydrolase II
VEILDEGLRNRAFVVASNAATATTSRESPRHRTFLEGAALDSLPALNERNKADDAAENKTPLPGQRRVSENNTVDDRNVNDRERGAEARADSPEQEAVLEQSVEDREGAAVLFRVHVEQAAGQVFGFPRHDAEEDGQDAVSRGAGAEGQGAGVVVAVVAVGAQVAVAVRVHDDHEADQAECAHAGAVDEFVDYQLLGEDAGAQAVGRACHDV